MRDVTVDGTDIFAGSSFTVVDGVLRIYDINGVVVTAYAPGHWTKVSSAPQV